MGAVKKMAASPAQVVPGLRFSTYVGSDEEDRDVVTVLDVTPSHALLESSGDWNGWRPLELVASAIAEASVQQSPRTQR